MYKLLIMGALCAQPFLTTYKPIEDAREPYIAPVIEEKQFTQYEPAKEEKPIGEPQKASVRVSGDWVAQCHAWAKQAGITLPPAAIKLIDKESDCNPRAQNPTSTAYGIGQFLNSTWGLKGVNCTKTSDPVRQLVCMDRYVRNVRGGWEAALQFHYAHNWY